MDNYNSYEENSTLYKTMQSVRSKREGRILLSVCAMTVFLGLALGVILYRITGDDIPFNTNDLVNRYFGGMFAASGGIGGRISVIFSSFLHELMFPALVFVLGYTVFSPVFASALCVWKSALCSYAVCMLEFTTVNGIFIESLLFLLTQIAIICINASVAMRAFVFSNKFNSRKRSIEDIFKNRDSTNYMLDFVISAGGLFISVAGSIILINLIR